MIDLDRPVEVPAGTLPDILRDNASRDPDAVAFIQLNFPAGADPDGRGVPETLSRGEYHRRAAEVASVLATRVRPADRVLVLLDPGLDLLVGLTGVLYAGAVAAACAPPSADVADLRAERVLRIVEQADIAAVVTTAALRDRLSGLRDQLGELPWFAVDEAVDPALVRSFVAPAIRGEDLALLQFSPGPTGAGRGIMVSHANLLAQIRQTVSLAGLPQGANVVSWIPPYHALGIAGHLLLSQYLGGRAVLLAPEDFVADPLRWLRAVSDTPGPVFSCAPNFAFERCVEYIGTDRREGLDLSGWHTAFNAAERVRPGTLARFVEAFGPYGFSAPVLAPGYGMSETMLFLTGRHPETAPLVLRVDPVQLAQGRVTPVPAPATGTELVGLGPAGPHCEILVVHPTDRTPMPAGRVGEVWVRGPVVCQGYWKAPELTAETFGATLTDGTGPYLRTGDLGCWYEGELVLCGRRKELVIIRGRNLFPQDVEATCARVDPASAHLPAAAFAVDTDDEERLIVVQAVADDDPVGSEVLAGKLRAAVTGDHEVEAHEVLLVAPGEIPCHPDGSVRRDACRERYLAGALTPVAVSRAATPTGIEHAPLRGMLLALDAPLRAPVLLAELRRRLAALLSTTTADVAVDTPLAGLGLESLRAIELRRDLAEDLGTTVPLVEFMRASLTGLSSALSQRLESDTGGQEISWRPLVADPGHRHEPFALTEQQYAYFVGRSSGFELGEVSIHLYLEIDAPDLDLDRLAGALRRLVVQQEMLRAVVCADGTQRIQPVAGLPRVDIVHTDLSTLQAAERGAHLTAVRNQLSHQVLPIEHWPMFEVRTSGLPEGGTRVHVSLDLLIADVASVRLFFLEWGDLYADPRAQPHRAPVSFRDYVLALGQVPDTQAYQRSRDYWRRRIADLPPGPDLPVIGAGAGASRRRTRREHVLDEQRWAGLRQRAAARGVTPSVLQLAAFAEVLGRWSRRSRFTLNVPLFNRMPLHPAVDTIIGDFTAVTLLEIDLTGPAGLAALAERIQHQLWQDMEHRYFSGVEVMRELGRQRGMSPGLFSTVVFASAREQGRDATGEKGALGSAWLGEIAYAVSQTPQVLFDHQVYEDRGRLTFNWDVVEDAFPAGVLDDMFATYCSLLEQLADSDVAWEPGALDTLPASQRALQDSANSSTLPVADGMLHSAVVEQALSRPDATAVVAADATLTYGELYHRARTVGRQLQALEVGPQELVAVAVDKGAAQIVAVLGVLFAGAAYLPVDPDLPAARQQHLVSFGGCRVVLERPGAAQQSWPDGVRSLTVDITGPPGDDPGPWEMVGNPGDLAYVIFTSGSTGTPKGVMIRHSAARNTVEDINERYRVGPHDAVLGLSSLSFDLSVWDIFGVLGAGGRLVLPRPGSNRDPAHWAELVGRHRVTVWNSVPALAQMLVEQVIGSSAAELLTTLRLVLLSGDWIPLELPDRLRALAPDCRPVSLGGATEASIWSIAYDIGAHPAGWESVPYGRALRNQSFHVLDDRWQECPAWVTGELYIGGVGLADGYWRDEERSAARFVTHPATGQRLYRTGDLGRWRPDGEIEFLGREDLQVKIGGYRIELGEIEAALTRHEAVRDAVVVAAGPDRHRRRLVGFVVPATDGGSDGTAASAASDLDPVVAEKKVLGDVVADPVQRIEFTLARHALRADLPDRPVALPAGPAEETAARWQRRASRRTFADVPVPLEDLGGLLEPLRSVDAAVLPKYRYASAGALYPVQTYVYVKPGRVTGMDGGSYYHDPASHRLVPVDVGGRLDPSVHMSTNGAAFDGSAFEIFLVGRMSAIEPLYGSRALHFCLLEAGQISQLLDDTAPELRLGLLQLGLLADEAPVRRLLALADDDVLLHSLLGGVYEPAGGAGSTDTGGPLTGQLRTHLATTLPGYMVPGGLVMLDKLPLSGQGKVDRGALERLAATQPDTDRATAATPYVTPGSTVERTIAEVVGRVLEIDRIGLDDRFFDLGADSVALVRVYRQLCSALDTRFPLMHMFEHPTVRRLAAGLDGAGATTDSVDAAFASGNRRRARRHGRTTLPTETEERS